MALLSIQVEPIVKAALLEDLAQGDMTTDNGLFHSQCATAVFSARQSCVVSGLELVREVFAQIDSDVSVELHCQNGDALEKGARMLTVSGCTASILKAERVALNFLQHLCGIATETRKFVDAISGTDAKITDTRKTTPGLRLLEKQAVIDGGGSPHRYNLGSAVMIKDNHIKAAGGVAEAIAGYRGKISHTATIEVEADTTAQVEEAVKAGADIVMLDNMSLDQIRVGLSIIGNRARSEVSGGVSLESVAEIAKTGVQYISTSKITLGAGVVDIGLDFL